MPSNKDLKRLVRTRMAETGENYTQALSALLSTPELEPVPAPWHVSGTHRASTRPDCCPRQRSYDGSRVVRLRRATASPSRGLRHAHAEHLGRRYTGRRVRFAAAVQTHEVSDWAGLWLRLDTTSGTRQIVKRHDRPLT